MATNVDQLPTGFVVDTDLPDGFVLDEDRRTKSEISSKGLKHIPTIYSATPKDLGRIAVGVPETVVNTAGQLATLGASGLAGMNSASLNNQRREFGGREDYETGRPAMTGPRSDTFTTDTIGEVQRMGGELFHPRTQGGEQVQQTLEAGIDVAGKGIKTVLSAFPLLISGPEEREEFMNVPLGTYLGELAQDNGASPLWATVAHLVPDAILSGVAVKGGSALKTKPVAPSITALKSKAAEMYKIVDASGARISTQAYEAFLRRLDPIAKKIDPQLHPDAYRAYQRLLNEDVSSGFSFGQAQILREIVGDAAGAVKSKDAFRAARLRDQFDDFMDTVPTKHIIGVEGKEAIEAWKLGRELWKRSRKTEIIEELIEKAKRNAEKATGMSGLGHTLRIKFGQLADNSRKMRQFSPAERKAIELVVRGGPIEKMTRYLGKFDPVNPWNVLGDMGIGAGVGMWMGGPAGAAIGAATVPILGRTGRYSSNKITAKYARKASQQARLGQ